MAPFLNTTRFPDQLTRAAATGAGPLSDDPLWSPDLFQFTVIRNPMTRFLSHLLHALTLPKPLFEELNKVNHDSSRCQDSNKVAINQSVLKVAIADAGSKQGHPRGVAD